MGRSSKRFAAKENAETCNCNHNEYHEGLLRYRCRNTFFVDAHRLGNGHGAADVAYLHALFQGSHTDRFLSRIAVALKADSVHIHRFGIAEHALARFFVGSNAAI